MLLTGEATGFEIPGFDKPVEGVHAYEYGEMPPRAVAVSVDELPVQNVTFEDMDTLAGEQFTFTL